MKKLLLLVLLGIATLSVGGCWYYYGGYGYADGEVAVNVAPAPAVYYNPPAYRYYWWPWTPAVEYRYYNPVSRVYIDGDRYYHRTPSRVVHPTRRVEVRH
jgi:hypothetical protein